MIVVVFIRVSLVHSRSLASFGRAPWFDGIIRVSLVHSGVPRWSSGSLGFLWIILARQGVRRVQSGSFRSFGRATGVVGFIRVLLLHWRPPRGEGGSSCSFASFGEFGGASWAIRDGLVHSSAPGRSSGSFALIEVRRGGHSVLFQRDPRGFRVCLVHSGALWGS